MTKELGKIFESHPKRSVVQRLEPELLRYVWMFLPHVGAVTPAARMGGHHRGTRGANIIPPQLPAPYLPSHLIQHPFHIGPGRRCWSLCLSANVYWVGVQLLARGICKIFEIRPIPEHFISSGFCFSCDIQLLCLNVVFSCFGRHVCTKRCVSTLEKCCF